jgi:hypothetical protein
MAACVGATWTSTGAMSPCARAEVVRCVGMEGWLARWLALSDDGGTNAHCSSSARPIGIGGARMANIEGGIVDTP